MNSKSNQPSEEGQLRIRRPRFDSYIRRSREQKRQAAVAFKENELPLLPHAETIGEILDAFIAATIDSKSFGDDIGRINNWIRPPFAAETPGWLTLARLEAWLKSMPGAENTRLNIYHLFHRIMEFARLRGMIETNPCTLPSSALPKRRTRPGFDAGRELVPTNHLERLGCDDDIPFYRQILYAVLGSSGLRLGESAALEVRDFDFSRACFIVSKNWSRKNKRIHETKDKQEREVPIHSAVLPLLIVWLERGWLQRFGRSPGPEDLVFAHRTNDGRAVHLVDRIALRRFHRDLRVIGLEPRRLHSLRHSFVSNWCSAGAREPVIRSITHPRQQTPRGGSFGVYRHFSLDEKREAVEIVPLSFERALP